MSSPSFEEFPAVPINRDRESPSVKEFYLIYDSLANPVAPAAGFPLHSNKLRGIRSLFRFNFNQTPVKAWSSTDVVFLI